MITISPYLFLEDDKASIAALFLFFDSFVKTTGCRSLLSIPKEHLRVCLLLNFFITLAAIEVYDDSGLALWLFSLSNVLLSPVKLFVENSLL